MPVFRPALSLPRRSDVPVSSYILFYDSLLGTDRVISLYIHLVTHGRYFSKFDFTYGRSTVYKETCTRRIDTRNPPATVYPSNPRPELLHNFKNSLHQNLLLRLCNLVFTATALYCVCDCDCDCVTALPLQLCVFRFCASDPCVQSVFRPIFSPRSRSSVVPTGCVRVFCGFFVLVRGCDQS